MALAFPGFAMVRAEGAAMTSSKSSRTCMCLLFKVGLHGAWAPAL